MNYKMKSKAIFWCKMHDEFALGMFYYTAEL